MFIVFDLDGTLALTDHRAHYLTGEKKDWRAFYAACDKDEPNWPVITTALALHEAGHIINIWSGRSDEVEDKTLAWLVGTGLDIFPLSLRKAGDHRHDTEIKAGWMAKYGKPDLVFEDRKRMVDMWRSHGVVCCQVAPGDF